MNLTLSDRTIALSVDVARATMGIDRLYRNETGFTDLHDGLVVLNMCDVQPEPFESYAEAQARLAEISARAFTLPEPDRRLYYTQACTSLWSFCEWRQGKFEGIADQIGLFLHADPAAATQAQLDAYNKKLYGLLGEAGYDGDLKRRIAKWEQKHLVPADEVQGTMDQMMVEARERTGNILELPDNDYYHCETVPSAPFNASSDYGNRRVIVNTAPVLTTQKLKHLVCHEVYPGHFMQFTLRRVAWERGIGGLDGTLSVCNHSSSCTFEGIADAGMAFLDWDGTIDDKINDLISIIQSALATAASHRMHTLGWENSRVEAFLRDNAPGGGEGWVNNRMGFISDPARAALIWSYWRGDEGVFPVWKRVERRDRAAFFTYIYNRLHTIQSLQLFRQEA
ncbi:MAG: DUF885 domain-containing protein [Clostridiales bacterium]|nr:DUF885 domain-containing protein [Clostridiales bacterium]